MSEESSVTPMSRTLEQLCVSREFLSQQLKVKQAVAYFQIRSIAIVFVAFW